MRLEIRQVALDDFPNAGYVHAEIFMDEHIAQPNDALSIHFGVSGFKGL